MIAQNLRRVIIIGCGLLGVFFVYSGAFYSLDFCSIGIGITAGAADKDNGKDPPPDPPPDDGMNPGPPTPPPGGGDKGNCQGSALESNAGPDQKVLPGDLVTLDGSYQGDKGGVVTYEWEQTGGPNVTLSNPTILNPIFVLPLGGNTGHKIRLELSVTEGECTKTDDVEVSYLRKKPECNVAYGTIANFGENILAFAFDKTKCNFFNSSGKNVKYWWEVITVPVGEPWGQFDDDDTLASRFRASKKGKHAVRLCVEEMGETDVTCKDVELTVENYGPFINIDVTKGEDAIAILEPKMILDLNAFDKITISDLNIDALTREWVQLSGDPVGLDNGKIDCKDGCVKGKRTFRVRVSDGEEEASSDVTLSFPNNPPEPKEVDEYDFRDGDVPILSGKDSMKFGAFKSELALSNVTCDDIDEDDLSYALVLDKAYGAKPAKSFGIRSAVAGKVKLYMKLAGTYTLGFTCDDGDEGVANKVVEIFVPTPVITEDFQVRIKRRNVYDGIETVMGTLKSSVYPTSIKINGIEAAVELTTDSGSRDDSVQAVKLTNDESLSATCLGNVCYDVYSFTANEVPNPNYGDVDIKIYTDVDGEMALLLSSTDVSNQSNFGDDGNDNSNNGGDVEEVQRGYAIGGGCGGFILSNSDTMPKHYFAPMVVLIVFLVIFRQLKTHQK